MFFRYIAYIPSLFIKNTPDIIARGAPSFVNLEWDEAHCGKTETTNRKPPLIF